MTLTVDDGSTLRQNCYQKATHSLNYERLSSGEQCTLSVNTGGFFTRQYSVQWGVNKLVLTRLGWLSSRTEYSLSDQLRAKSHEYQLLKTISLQASVTFLHQELFTSPLPIRAHAFDIINALPVDKATQLLSQVFVNIASPNIDGLARTLEHLSPKIALTMFQSLTSETKTMLLQSRYWCHSQMQAQLFFELSMLEQQTFVTQASKATLSRLFMSIPALVQGMEVDNEDWVNIEIPSEKTQTTKYSARLTVLFQQLNGMPDIKKKCSQVIILLPIKDFLSFTKLFSESDQHQLSWLQGFVKVANNLQPLQEELACCINAYTKDESLSLLKLLPARAFVQVLAAMPTDQALGYLKQPQLDHKRQEVRDFMIDACAGSQPADDVRPSVYETLGTRGHLQTATLCFFFDPISFEAFLSQLAPQDAKAIVGKLLFLANQTEHNFAPKLFNRLPSSYILDTMHSQKRDYLKFLLMLPNPTVARVISEWQLSDWDKFLPKYKTYLISLPQKLSPDLRQTLLRRIPWEYWQKMMTQLPSSELWKITDFTYKPHFMTWWHFTERADQSWAFNHCTPLTRTGCLLFLSINNLLPLLLTTTPKHLAQLIAQHTFQLKLANILIAMVTQQQKPLIDACRLLTQQYPHWGESESTSLIGSCCAKNVAAVTQTLAKLHKGEQAAQVIENAYRAHLDQTHLLHKQNQSSANVTQPQVQHSTYYFDPEKVYPPMRSPMGSKDLIGVHRYGLAYGANKYITRQDDHYIEFVPSRFKKDSDGKPRIRPFNTNHNFKTLMLHRHIQQVLDNPKAEDSCFSPGLLGIVKTDTQMLAVKGGIDLGCYLNKHDSIPLDPFKPLTAQLAKLHQAGIIHRDLKPKNILIRDSIMNDGKLFWLPNLQLKIIDFSDCITPNSGNSQIHCGTLSFLTQTLIAGRTAESRACGLPININSDNYALLITIFVAINLKFRSSPLMHPESAQRKLRIDRTFTKGILTEYEMNYPKGHACLHRLIQHYIKPKYRAYVIKFLHNPTSNGLPASLHEVINWGAGRIPLPSN